MARASLSVKGVDQLVGKLKRNANLNDVKNIVKMNGSEMQRKAKRFAPVDTGNLERNIQLYIENNGFTAKTVSEAEYAGYQEYGTRYQPGTPHIRPAFHQQKRQFVKDMRRLMK
jgi:HK97 gp10 family phage protein